MGAKLKAVHQFHAGVSYGDAVTSYMITLQRIFTELGFKSDIFSISPSKRFFHPVRHWEDHRFSSEEVLIIHHSSGNPCLSKLLELPCRKIALFQNITPQKYFSDPRLKGIIQLGYDQIPMLGKAVETWLSTSDTNARVLRPQGQNHVLRIPMVVPFVDGAPRCAQKRNNKLKTLIFVGRVVPNKCQEELILLMKHYVDNFGPENIQLILIGNEDSYAQYSRYCKALIDNLSLTRSVRMLGVLPEVALRQWYDVADLFISLSEHEGIGVPLIEAMVHQVPILAFAEAGVAETVGGGGVLLQEKSPNIFVQWMYKILYRTISLDSMLRVQQRRLQDFSYANCKQWVENNLIRDILA